MVARFDALAVSAFFLLSINGKAHAHSDLNNFKNSSVALSLTKPSFVRLTKKGEVFLKRNDVAKAYQIFIRLKQAVEIEEENECHKRFSSFRNNLLLAVNNEAQAEEARNNFEGASNSLERAVTLSSKGEEYNQAIMRVAEFYMRHENEPSLLLKRSFNTALYLRSVKAGEQDRK